MRYKNSSKESERQGKWLDKRRVGLLSVPDLEGVYKPLLTSETLGIWKALPTNLFKACDGLFWIHFLIQLVACNTWKL